MPQQLKMQIFSNQRAAMNLMPNEPHKKVELKKAPTSLKSPMVMRIHNVKPGCSACGK